MKVRGFKSFDLDMIFVDKIKAQDNDDMKFMNQMVLLFFNTLTAAYKAILTFCRIPLYMSLQSINVPKPRHLFYPPQPKLPNAQVCKFACLLL